MIELTAGQNIPLTGATVRFSAKADAALDMCALVVDANLKVHSSADAVFYNQPATTGVVAAADGITITPAAVRPDAAAVLLVVSADPGTPPRPERLGPVLATLSENGGVIAEFPITPLSGETALICLEVYRRGPGWKLRAVGQGYAGGLAVLFTTHGVDVDGAEGGADRGAGGASEERHQAARSGAYALSSHPVDETRTAPAGTPLEVGHGLERLWMIFEDAARSAAALISAREYAAQRLDNELSLAVSDPATRNSPAAAEACRVAQRRNDELIETAERNHQRDSEQLVRELAEADLVLPPALASWGSPAWDGPPTVSDGIRLGELYALDRGPLRIPYCVPVPLNRPLWIDTESTHAVAPVVGALLARLLAAAPQRRTLVDIIDMTGAFSGFTDLLTPVLNGPPITDHTEISARLQALVDAAELAELAQLSGAAMPPSTHRVLLAADFPHGYQSSDAQRLGVLIAKGAALGLSTVIIGAVDSAVVGTTVAMLSRLCQHLPVAGATPLFDPWTGSAWQLDLDLLPREPDQRARFLRTR
ncbi:TerD family protein [Nocardia sp. 004]|uniref:TerD family protein n=1 Tax=Nocardia sp. 004 TaxID=3385978 RepID=UPI0039A31885